MAYTKRVWTPRVVQYPGREILTPTGNPNEFDPARSEGIITTPGDILSAENLNDLEARIFNQFGIVPEASSNPWLPEIYGYGVAGAPTYSIQIGTYRKHGNLCHIFVHIKLTGKGGMTSYLTIRGLPFGAALSTALLISNVGGVTGLTGIIQPYVYGDGNIIPLQTISSTGIAPMTADNILDTFEIYMAGTYETI